MSPERRRIVVATGDTLTERMAGPAIRAWNIARLLAAEHDVELVTTERCTLRHDAFNVRQVQPADVDRLADWADVVVFQGTFLHEHPVLESTDAILVADVYDPFHLEQLEQARDLGERDRRDVVQSATAILNDQLSRGDFFLCASDKQRDFWLGQLAALGRINPVTYDADETLRSLIAVAPFGIDEVPPLHTRPAVKGARPGIARDDELILWGGGIYNWFDPLTLIQAMEVVVTRRPRARLLFMGGRHPNPAVPRMRMAVEARRLAASVGLLDTHVFFNEEWVAYADRQNYLLEADLGVSTHLDHVETAFSFRTRILDYVWAQLPIVCTDGDALAQLVTSAGLGRAVPPGDAAALATAIVDILEDGAERARCARHLADIAPQFHWPVALRPLLEFCRAPQPAPDRPDADSAPRLGRPLDVVPPRWRGVRGDLRLAREYLRRGGLRLAISKAVGRVRRLHRGELRPR